MEEGHSELETGSAFLEAAKRLLDIPILGVADIIQEREQFSLLPRQVIAELPFAIVIGKRVSPTVLGTLEDGPNLIYFHHYRQLNVSLDQAAHKIASEIEELGYKALPIPASQIVDWEKYTGHVSHKRLAWLAGLGWWGRNNLLVTPKWGARVRLASVLTNLPLSPVSPIDADCGSCQRCLSVCPAKAIKESREDFDYTACFSKLKEFRATRGIGQHICGLCVKCCLGRE